MDLLGGKYAQASDNIDAGKVKKVQVLERHQPIRALRIRSSAIRQHSTSC